MHVVIASKLWGCWVDVFENPPSASAPGNQPEYTVSELSGAVKRIIEGEFGLVQVRGEVRRVSRADPDPARLDLSAGLFPD